MPSRRDDQVDPVFPSLESLLGDIREAGPMGPSQEEYDRLKHRVWVGTGLLPTPEGGPPPTDSGGPAGAPSSGPPPLPPATGATAAAGSGAGALGAGGAAGVGATTTSASAGLLGWIALTSIVSLGAIVAHFALSPSVAPPTQHVGDASSSPETATSSAAVAAPSAAQRPSMPDPNPTEARGPLPFLAESEKHDVKPQQRRTHKKRRRSTRARTQRKTSVPIPRKNQAVTPPEPAPEPAVTKNEMRSALTAERRILDAARRALRKRRFAKVLSLVREHRLRFTAARLDEERDVLEIRAYVRHGNPKAARQAARAFRMRYPQSPFLLTIDIILEERD